MCTCGVTCVQPCDCKCDSKFGSNWGHPEIDRIHTITSKEHPVNFILGALYITYWHLRQALFSPPPFLHSGHLPWFAVQTRPCTLGRRQARKGLIWRFLFVCLFVSFFFWHLKQTVQRTEHCVPPGGSVVDSYVRFLPGSRAEPHWHWHTPN